MFDPLLGGVRGVGLEGASGPDSFVASVADSCAISGADRVFGVSSGHCGPVSPRGILRSVCTEDGAFVDSSAVVVCVPTGDSRVCSGCCGRGSPRGRLRAAPTGDEAGAWPPAKGACGPPAGRPPIPIGACGPPTGRCGRISGFCGMTVVSGRNAAERPGAAVGFCGMTVVASESAPERRGNGPGRCGITVVAC